MLYLPKEPLFCLYKLHLLGRYLVIDIMELGPLAQVFQGIKSMGVECSSRRYPDRTSFDALDFSVPPVII